MGVEGGDWVVRRVLYRLEPIRLRWSCKVHTDFRALEGNDDRQYLLC